METPQTEERALLQLHVPPEIKDGAVEVRWCLTAHGRELLEKRRITDPYVLLIMAHDNPRIPEVRQVVRLQELATYISFRAPGTNHLFAAVVWRFSMRHDAVRDEFLSSRNGEFYNDVLCEDRSGFLWRVKERFGEGQPAPLSLQVPSEVFSPEPRDLRWLTMVLGGPLVDDCAVRQRRLFAYSLQPVALCLYGLLVALCAVAIGLMRGLQLLFGLLLGLRNLKFRDFVDLNIRDPLGGSNFVEDSIFIPRIGRRSLYFLFAFSPLPVFGFFGLIEYWLWAKHRQFPSLSKAALYTGCAVAGLALVMAVIQLLANWKPIARSVMRLWTRIEAYLTKDDKPWFEDPQVVANMTCDETGASPSGAKLPRRTIRLRFLATKAKACSPLPYRSR